MTMRDGSARRAVEGVEAAWRRLRDTAARLGPERLELATTAGWTAKEMLAHVAFWQEAIEGAVTVLFRGQPLPAGWSFGSAYAPEGEDWPAADVHNAREAAWARQRSSEDVLQRLDAAHGRFLAFMATVSDDEVSGHVDYFAGLPAHLLEHLAELEALAGASAEVRQ
jgi:hypothetical protein